MNIKKAIQNAKETSLMIASATVFLAHATVQSAVVVKKDIDEKICNAMFK